MSYQRQTDIVDRQSYSDFLAAKYWSTWLLLGVLWLLSWLPFSLLITMGRMIGRLLYRFTPARRRICDINLSLCFPRWPEQERQRLLKATYLSYGMGLMETLVAWFRAPRHLLDSVEFHGLEHIEQGLVEGKGVLMVSGHFTIIDLAAYFFGTRAEFSVVQRQQNNLLLNYFITRARRRSIKHCIARKDIRGMLRCLKRNEILWYAPDQDYGRTESVFVSFFGIQTATITATSRLAKMTGAKVLPCSFLRLKDGRYRVNVYPALAIPSGDDKADARSYNDWLEQEIEQCPEQYLWFHRRFKTRPDGEASFYQ